MLYCERRLLLKSLALRDCRRHTNRQSVPGRAAVPASARHCHRTAVLGQRPGVLYPPARRLPLGRRRGGLRTQGSVGPNLNVLQPTSARVRVAVSQGVGAMPSFGAQLSAHEIEALAAYVAEATAP